MSAARRGEGREKSLCHARWSPGVLHPFKNLTESLKKSVRLLTTMRLKALLGAGVRRGGGRAA